MKMNSSHVLVKLVIKYVADKLQPIWYNLHTSGSESWLVLDPNTDV